MLPSSSSYRRVSIAFLIAVAGAVAFVAVDEYRRWQIVREANGGIALLLSFPQIDSTPYAVLLVLLPVFWWLRTPLFRLPRRLSDSFQVWFGPETKPSTPDHPSDNFRAFLLAVVVAATSLNASLFVAGRPVSIDKRTTVKFGELPPAYHDEYSYRFQAETMLAGRWSFESDPTLPRVFDQMHVVNEGRYAGRYFPATAAWMAPFLNLGRPYWGHWLAGMLTAGFIFAAGRELGGNGVGFLAGMLTAVAPGLAVFSNLLLAHHPTLLGLSLFLWMILRLLRTRQWWCATLAGLGLAFAMLARPMSAFGCGLPFGVVFAVWLFRSGDVKHRARFVMTTTAAIGLPIAAGFAVLGWQNHAVSGSVLKSPYQLFMETYTPRHVYGFNNVNRAERRIAAGEALTNNVFENYDRWAVNLTPGLVAENVGNRLLGTGRWTLGIVPLFMAGLLFVVCLHREEPRWWLIAAAILSMHIAHIPYWYDGIMHWHYVFETGPLWLLVFARSTQLLFGFCRDANRPNLPLWWSAVAATAIATAYLSLPAVWGPSRVDAAVSELSFSRVKYLRFNEFLAEMIGPKEGALVLIEHDPADRHIDYVTNHPDHAKQRILRGRFLPNRMSMREIVEAFPDRSVFLFRVKAGTFDRLSSGGRGGRNVQ